VQRLSIPEAFERLHDHFGPQHWWPGDTPDEVIVGCVLTQNTRWENVERVIEALKGKRLIYPQLYTKLSREELALQLRGCGTYRQKAEYLLNLGKYLLDRGWTGDPDSLSEVDTDVLRSELLAVRGVGPETADSILLYALQRPVFVVDAYTRRILARHNMGANLAYEGIQRLFMESLPTEVGLFNEYHALMVACGKTYCRRKPLCGECPLASDLAEA
jgi:endonuclease-3 related protein